MLPNLAAEKQNLLESKRECSFGASENVTAITKPQTLQEAFLRFCKKRQAELSVSRNVNSKVDNGPLRKAELRKAFVDRCLHYLGVPYKKKYHQPGTADYHSNIFLDCCGLIRRVLKDLRTDFGFEIGPWNQGYMFDTLPTVIEREEAMQPGDLVFISGKYFNKKIRQQPHDMVHVEVWLGEGKKTIGARWHKGRVQIFDSYRFESTSYHSMEYHFRSIDAWLQGRCESVCARHPWKRAVHFEPSKRSVFFSSSNLGCVERRSRSSDVTIEDYQAQDDGSNEQRHSHDSLLNKEPTASSTKLLHSHPTNLVGNLKPDKIALGKITNCSRMSSAVTNDWSNNTAVRDRKVGSENETDEELDQPVSAVNELASVRNLREPMYFFTTKRICHLTSTWSADSSRHVTNADFSNHNAVDDGAMAVGVAEVAIERALAELELEH